MPLETATYIHDLVATNPVHTDGLAQADSHMRLIKSVLQATFPNLTGAVTVTQDDINFGQSPVGSVIFFDGDPATLPANWHACDGSVYTPGGGHGPFTLPDFRNVFPIGAGSTYANGSTGGATSGTTSSDGSHTHTGSTGLYTLTIGDIPAHAHGVTDGGHTHTSPFSGLAGAGGSGSNDFLSGPNGSQTSSSTTGITLQNTGGGGSHGHTISADGDHTHTVATMPPFRAINFIKRLW